MIKEVYITKPGKKRFPIPTPSWAFGVALVVVTIFIGSCEWVRGM
jgi:hypothetical protein